MTTELKSDSSSPPAPPEPPAPSFGSLLGKAAGLLAAMTLITGLAYPLLMTGIAQAAFPEQANGSLVVRDGAIVGSRLVGQPWSDAKYFWGRLSATSPSPYNASASTGSNLGPTNEAVTTAAKQRIDALRAADPGNDAPVPVDLVTASASGLDPHITPAAAEYQVRRVARLRGVDEAKIRALVSAATSDRELGILAEPRVNVLELNLSLDRL